MEKSDAEDSPFFNDRAIENKKDDLLNRAKFAENIATTISKYKNKDNLIIGVYGEWGSGKSSVKNMIIECLKGRAKVVQFNPWEWQEQHAIAKELFNQVQIGLYSSKNKENKKKIEKIIKKLKKYALRLRIASIIFRPLGKSNKWIFTILGAIGVTPFLKLLNGYSHWLLLIPVVILSFVSLSDYLANFFDVLHDCLSFEENKSLQTIKEEVAELLNELDNPIVTMIDDIDRLNKNETKLLFQIIKANSDFPNLIYVLFFQRDIVEAHLHEDGISGSEYLKKIIQVPFELPKPSIQAIHSFFHENMEKIIIHNNLSHLNDYYQKKVLLVNFYGYFNNLRDIKRFISIFQFQLNMMKTNNTLEVNIMDLILLEVIRQYEPKFYENIYKYKKYFIENFSSSPELFEENRKFINSIIKNESLKDIVRYLFPNLKKYFEGRLTNKPYIGESSLRLYHPDFFDRYFQLQLSEGEVSQEEIEKIIINSADIEALRKHFEVLEKNNILTKLIYRLYQSPIDIKKENLSNFVIVLFDFGDSLSQSQPSYDLTKTYITVIIDRIIRAEADKNKKLTCISKSLKETNGVYLPLYWLGTELDKIKSPTGNDPNFEEENIELLQKLGLEIIHKARDNGKLESLKNLGLILLLWVECGDLEGENLWINHLIRTGEGFLKFLCAISLYGKSITSGLKKNIDSILVDKKIIDLHQLMRHVGIINGLQLNSEEKYSIKALYDVCERYNIQMAEA